MNASLSTPSARAFQATLARYIELRSKVDPAEIVQRKTRSVVIELYRATKAAAPTRQEIKADVERQGWRVKRPPGAWPRRKGERRGSRGPLKRMQASAVKRRARAIGYAASGFIPALNGLGAKPTAKDAGNFPRPQGSLIQSGAGTTRPVAIIRNETPGIVAVEKKHRVTDAAFQAVTKDTQAYIEKKTQQTASRIRR